MIKGSVLFYFVILFSSSFSFSSYHFILPSRTSDGPFVGSSECFPAKASRQRRATQSLSQATCSAGLPNPCHQPQISTGLPNLCQHPHLAQGYLILATNHRLAQGYPILATSHRLAQGYPIFAITHT